MSSYVGKYVCYQALDGGATFGLIKAEIITSTQSGPQPAFIISDRYTQILSDDVRTYRQWHPNAGDLSLSRSMQVDEDGNTSQPEGYLLKRIKGDSTLRLSSIDLENDIIDPDKFFEQFTTDEIFMALVIGKDRIKEGDLKKISKMRVAEIGLRYCIDIERLKEELKKRSQ